MNLIICYLILFLNLLSHLAISQVNAQMGTYHQLLPRDLEQETLIVLRYDFIKDTENIPANLPDNAYRRLKNHNSHVLNANKLLVEGLKNYPFKYHIASIEDLDTLYSSGYKYVLYFPSFTDYLQGSEFRKSPVHGLMFSRPILTFDNFSEDLMIINLEDNSRYFAGKVRNATPYDYAVIMNTLNREVKMQFRQQLRK